MKKILLSSFVLIVFSLSIIIFQMSCRKTAIAQTSSSLQTLNKVLLLMPIQIQTGTTNDSLGHSTAIYRTSFDFYFIQYDGTNLKKINIPMPAGEYPYGIASLSSDGKHIVFVANNVNGNSVYSYALDDSKLTKLVDGDYFVQGAN